MSDAAHWPYGGGATGQPTPLDPTTPPDTQPQPCPFGGQYARILGRPRVVLVQQPGAGAEWLYKHAGPSFLVLRAVSWQLVTSAVVATRASRLVLKLGVDRAAQFPPSATQAASLTVVYNACDAGLSSGDPATIAVALGNSCILADNMSLGSSTSNIDVADQYSAIAIFAEEFSDFEDWDE